MWTTAVQGTQHIGERGKTIFKGSRLFNIHWLTEYDKQLKRENTFYADIFLWNNIQMDDYKWHHLWPGVRLGLSYCLSTQVLLTCLKHWSVLLHMYTSHIYSWIGIYYDNIFHNFMLTKGANIVAALSVRQSVRYLVRQKTLKLLLAFELNLVYRKIAMRERTVHQNHNPILYIY
mgnify:CR=1 FL=1